MCVQGREVWREREGEQLVAVACVCVCVWQCDLLLPHKHTRHTQALSVCCTLGSRSLPLSLSLFFSFSLSLSYSLSFSCCVLFLLCGQLTNVCGQNCIQIEWLGPSTDWLTDWLINRLVSVWVCAPLCSVSVCGRGRERGGVQKINHFQISCSSDISIHWQSSKVVYLELN